jgi:hypothetical protein
MRQDLIHHPVFGPKVQAWIKYWNEHHGEDQRINGRK